MKKNTNFVKDCEQFINPIYAIAVFFPTDDELAIKNGTCLMLPKGSGTVAVTAARDFEDGTADAKTGSYAYYAMKVSELANYGIDNDSEDTDDLYVKAVINNNTKKFKLFINGVQVTINGYSEFDFYAAATGVGAVAFQRNSVNNTHKLASIRCYVPGNLSKPVAKTCLLDYNAYDKKINIRSLENRACNLYVANYVDNELIGISAINNVELKANQDTQISVKSNISKKADTIKIFLWSAETDSIVPISKNILTNLISSN